MDPIEIIKSEIESAEAELRDVNIERIIKSLGVHLDKQADLDPDISGQISRIKGDVFEISTNRTDNYFRQRFTMAHELGHYLYHRALLGRGVDDSKAYRSVPEGNFYNRNITSRHETEANQFAANILMPMRLIKAVAQHQDIDLNNLNETDVAEIAKMIKVSKQALSIRLRK